MGGFISIHHFKNYHWLAVGYLVIWIVLILAHFSNISSASLFLFFHFILLLITVSMGLIAPRLSFLKFLKNWNLFLFLPLLFTALHYLIPSIHNRNIDPVLIQVDLWLTGTYPTVWLERWYSPVLTEILQLYYLTFYFLPLLVLIPSYRRENFHYFDRCAFAILLTFYLSYFGYLIFPALGPRYFLSHLQSFALDGAGFYHSINTTLNGLENIQWDAFPSGHVAIALVFSHFAYLFYRKIFYFSLPVIGFLVISTVYLRYHYLVDVLAGFALYLIVMVIESVVDRRFGIKKN